MKVERRGESNKGRRKTHKKEIKIKKNEERMKRKMKKVRHGNE